MVTGLITRSLKGPSSLKLWAKENNVALNERSFIQIIPLPNLTIPKSDWIFFSSPNGLKLYCENYSLLAKKIGVLSKGTAEMAKNFEIIPDFIGDPYSNTEAIALEFSTIVGASTVFFPISDKSLKTVSKMVSNKIERVVYNTIVLTHEIPEGLAFIVCTSPSNALGLIQSGLSKNFSGKLFVYGDQTAAALCKENFEPIKIPAFTDEAIIHSLEEML